MKNPAVRGQTANIAFVFIPDAASTVGAGKTGLTNASAGLNVAVRRERTAAFTSYTGANIGTITTLGTWANPGAGKCNIKECDATNAPGLYELHLEDTLFGTADTSRKLVGMVQVTGGAPAPFEIPLWSFDHEDAQRAGLAALPATGTLTINPTLTIIGTVNDAAATATQFNISVVAPRSLAGRYLAFTSGVNQSYAARVLTDTGTGTTPRTLTFSAGVFVAPGNGDAWTVLGA